LWFSGVNTPKNVDDLFFGALSLGPKRREACKITRLRLMELAWALQEHIRAGQEGIETERLWCLIAQYCYMSNTSRGHAPIAKEERDEIFRVAYQQLWRMEP
jgi:hypothetical protein